MIRTGGFETVRFRDEEGGSRAFGSQTDLAVLPRRTETARHLRILDSRVTCYETRAGSCVEITFVDRNIRDLCCSHANVVRKFGAKLARKICCRLSMLAAAPSLAHVPVSPPISLARLDSRTFSVALGASHQLIFRAASPRPTQVGSLSQISEIHMVGPTPVPAKKGKQK
jgi:hypothetical protein